MLIAAGFYAATGNYSFAQAGYQVLAGESPYNNGRNGVWPLFKLDRWTGEMWTCRWDWLNSHISRRSMHPADRSKRMAAYSCRQLF